MKMFENIFGEQRSLTKEEQEIYSKYLEKNSTKTSRNYFTMSDAFDTTIKQRKAFDEILKKSKKEGVINEE